MYVGRTSKGFSVFARRKLSKGEFICKYQGDLCSYKGFRNRHLEYNSTGRGSYILEFKYKEKRWAIDATEDNKTFGRLINHSKHNGNIKPLVGDKNGKPFVYFTACRNIETHEELLYDYGDNSKYSVQNFPWLKE